jgi:hypothetical protein
MLWLRGRFGLVVPVPLFGRQKGGAGLGPETGAEACERALR